MQRKDQITLCHNFDAQILDKRQKAYTHPCSRI